MTSKAWTNLYSSREIIWSLPFPVYRSFGRPDKTQQQEQSWRAWMVVTTPLRPFCHGWWSHHSNLPSHFWNWPLWNNLRCVCKASVQTHYEMTPPLYACFVLPLISANLKHYLASAPVGLSILEAFLPLKTFCRIEQHFPKDSVSCSFAGKGSDSVKWGNWGFLENCRRKFVVRRQRIGVGPHQKSSSDTAPLVTVVNQQTSHGVFIKLSLPQFRRMARVGRDLKDHETPSPQPQAGPPTSSSNTRPGYRGCHPIRPWTPPGMGHLQPLWAACFTILLLSPCVQETPNTFALPTWCPRAISKKSIRW